MVVVVGRGAITSPTSDEQKSRFPLYKALEPQGGESGTVAVAGARGREGEREQGLDWPS